MTKFNFAIVLSLGLISSVGSAKTAYLNELAGAVGQSPTTKCQTCHATNGNPKALNLFGKSFRKIFLSISPPPDVENMSSDEKWDYLLNGDANGNGRPDGEDIADGINPGN